MDNVQDIVNGLKEKIADFSVAASLAGRPEDVKTQGPLPQFDAAPLEREADFPQGRAVAAPVALAVPAAEDIAGVADREFTCASGALSNRPVVLTRELKALFILPGGPK